MKRKSIVLGLFLPLAQACATNAPPPTAEAGDKVVEGAERSDAGSPSIRPSLRACLDAAGGATLTMKDCMEAERDYHERRIMEVWSSIRGRMGGSRVYATQGPWRNAKACEWDPKTEGQAAMLQSVHCRMMRSALRADELESIANARQGGAVIPTTQEQDEFLSEAVRLTDQTGDVVLFEFAEGDGRMVAFIANYAKRAEWGGHCTVHIVEGDETGVTLVESSDELLSCGGINIHGKLAVTHSLEADIEPGSIKVDEDHVRSRTEYEIARGSDGRWHVIYTGDIEAQSHPDKDDVTIVKYTAAYETTAEAPTVSSFKPELIADKRIKSVMD